MKPAVPKTELRQAVLGGSSLLRKSVARSLGHQLDGDAIALGRDGDRLQAQDSFWPRRELP